jgi:hypothetical protein
MKMTKYSSIETLLNKIVMVCKIVGSIDAQKGGERGEGGTSCTPYKDF